MKFTLALGNRCIHSDSTEGTRHRASSNFTEREVHGCVPARQMNFFCDFFCFAAFIHALKMSLTLTLRYRRTRFRHIEGGIKVGEALVAGEGEAAETEVGVERVGRVVHPL